jgi:23S rRNA (uridine2552-2'-O)-methyltransferase
VKRAPIGTRGPRQKLRTARGRSKSSQLWLERQINDPYVKAAKAQGYRSRAAYKLLEMNAKHHFLKRGMTVVDLGAAPGGWTQVAAAEVGASGSVVAVDIQDMDGVPGAKAMKLDFMDNAAPDLIKAALGGAADAVLSDMASPATGHRETDHIRIMALCEAALDFALEVLAPGGTFLAKVLRGGTERTLLDTLKRRFTKIVHVKPPSSRADSAEMYVLALGYKP